MIKIIGITPLLGKTYGVDSSIILDNYINLVRFMGGIPVLLPDNPTQLELSYYKNLLDVLILQGGSNDSKEQELMEFKYIDLAINNKVPILGICRGLQELNVYFGGTLCDIGDETHNSDNCGDTLVHNVSIMSDTLTKTLINKDIIAVNSLHILELPPLNYNIII